MGPATSPVAPGPGHPPHKTWGPQAPGGARRALNGSTGHLHVGGEPVPRATLGTVSCLEKTPKCAISLHLTIVRFKDFAPGATLRHGRGDSDTGSIVRPFP